MVVALWFSIVIGSGVVYILAEVFHKLINGIFLPTWGIYVWIGFVSVVSLVFLGRILCAKLERRVDGNIRRII